MMDVDLALARACERVPSLVRSALVLLPDGYLLAGHGAASMMDLEPLIRATGRCLDTEPTFVEYLLVIDDQLVAIQRGRRDARLALAAVTTREPNLAFVLATTRRALDEVEATLDLSGWGP